MSAVVQSVNGFLGRNRRKFYWLGGTASAGYMLIKYAQWKWSEYQQRRELEQTAKSNVKRRFEQNLQDCTFAVASLLPTLGEQLFEGLNVELITAQLQQCRQAKNEAGRESPDGSVATSEEGSSSRKTKIELWEELKILSFTRTISAVYLVTLLIVFTHLQLNLLGRFFYLDSVVAFAPQVDDDADTPGVVVAAKKTVTDETERKYLTFSWFVLNVGWKGCVERVRRAVGEVVGSMSLKEPITYDVMLNIISQIRSQVEGDGFSEKVASYLLPEEGTEEEVLSASGGDDEEFTMDEELDVLLDETRDFVESTDFSHVLHSSLDEAFDLLAKQFRPTFITDQHAHSSVTELAPGQQQLDVGPVNKGKTLLLAGAIPVVSRVAHSVLNGVPNIFLEALSAQPELKAFSVVMYTGWEDRAP